MSRLHRSVAPLAIAGVIAAGVIGSIGSGYVARPPSSDGGGIPATSGAYQFLPNATNVSTSATLGVGTLRVVPFYVARSTTFDRIGAEVSSAGEAGSKFRICVYSTGTDGRPDALVNDAGQIDGTSATVQTITSTTTLSAPGWYWAGGVVQSVVTTQPTMRTSAQGAYGVMPVNYLSAPTSSQAASGYLMTGVTGACPATFVASDVHNSCARVFARVQ